MHPLGNADEGDYCAIGCGNTVRVIEARSQMDYELGP